MLAQLDDFGQEMSTFSKSNPRLSVKYKRLYNWPPTVPFEPTLAFQSGRDSDHGMAFCRLSAPAFNLTEGVSCAQDIFIVMRNRAEWWRELC